LEVFRAQGAEFVAACNRSPEGRRLAETQGGIPRTYARIGEMLDREQPQGVVCCASSDSMYEAALEILPHRIPTLLEKPPGLSLDEYCHLRESAQKHGTPVMVAMNRRHYSVVRRAVEDAGGLAAITAVSVEWSENPRHFLDRGFSAARVGREIFSNTLHGLDLITFLAGPVDDAEVLGLNLGEPLRWMMSLQGRSQRGALVTFNSSWDSPGRWRVSFCTPGRRYVFAPLETCQVLETGVAEPRAIEPDAVDLQYKPGFFGQAQSFLEMIATHQPPPPHSLAAVEPAMRLADKLTRAITRAESSDAPFAGPPSARSAVSRAGRESACANSPIGPLRVVAIADSLALARIKPVVIHWEETWPSRLAVELRAAGVDAEVINCGSRERTADLLLDYEFEEHVVCKQPDVVIVQVGIVDCSPRIFSRRERTFLNRRFVPARLRDWIVRRRSERRQELLRASDPLRKVYTSPGKFAECLDVFGARLAGLERRPRLIVLPIVCDREVMNEKSPGHHENVVKYNALLRSFAKAAGADWIEPGELIRDFEIADSFVSDGHHLSVSGSARCAQVLASLLAQAGPEEDASPPRVAAGSSR
jgi:predicted dehydrogenase